LAFYCSASLLSTPVRIELEKSKQGKESFDELNESPSEKAQQRTKE
jgi:hypothetical protein